MEQVKVFDGHCAEAIEKSVNAWLSEKQGSIVITERKMALSVHDGGRKEIIITIFYTPKH